MYDFGGCKTSIARPFIKKELCNQRPFKRALKCEFKNEKKLKIICWKKVEKMLKITYFQHFFSRFSTFFQFFFQHIFSIFFHFLDRQELSKIVSFWWKVTFYNGIASREESVTSKNTEFKGFYVFSYGGQIVMESDFSPKR